VRAFFPSTRQGSSLDASQRRALATSAKRSAGLQYLANQLLQLDEGKGLPQHGQSRLL